MGKFILRLFDVKIFLLCREWNGIDFLNMFSRASRLFLVNDMVYFCLRSEQTCCELRYIFSVCFVLVYTYMNMRSFRFSEMKMEERAGGGGNHMEVCFLSGLSVGNKFSLCNYLTYVKVIIET